MNIKVKYVVSVMLGITAYFTNAHFAHHVNTDLTGACEGMSQQVKVDYFQ